jgi:phosphatidylglycerophosphatase C
VQGISTIDLLQRLERAVRPDSVLAFDGDGTLWSGDVGEDYFQALIAEDALRAPALYTLSVWAQAHYRGGMTAERAAGLTKPEAPPPGTETHSASGIALATYLFAEYAAQRFAEDRICELIAWLPAGRTRAEMEAFAGRLLRERELETRIHAEAQAVVAWAEQKAIPVFVVSASPETIVIPAAGFLGIPQSRVLAVRPQYAPQSAQGAGSDYAIEPDVQRPIPYNEGKVQVLQAALKRLAPPSPGVRSAAGSPTVVRAPHLLAAFGDNAFDLPMLLSADFSVAIRPKERLRNRVREASVDARVWELEPLCP